MKILVGVPTYNNFRFGYSIRRTLEALANQSFRDFRVLIVYKPSPGDKTLDVVDEFGDKLDIEVKIQNEGFVEEAMNMIFEVSKDYDITLTTDDDAIPTKTWIKEHLTIHKQHENIGIFVGMVNNKFIEKWNDNLLKIEPLIGYYKPPLLSELRRYCQFINDMGLMTCNSNIANKIIKNNESMYYNGPIGVNMSFKSRFITDFKLPGTTIHGLHYEQLLMLYYITRHKMHSVVFKGANVEHIERESLSRTRTQKTLFMFLIEHTLLPYSITQLGIRINLKKLKTYYGLIKTYLKILNRFRFMAYETGLRLAIEAIENNYEPKEVRNRLIKLNETLNL